MFGTLVIKEIQETIHNFRFHFSVLLCLVLIPLGMYAALKNYEQRLTEYRESMRLYEQKSQGKITYNFRAEGYRPPLQRSVFAIGLEDYLPNKVLTERGGNFAISNEKGINNPQALLFGRLDFLFSAGFVLSILALIFTFSSISGEKEKGTLRLIVANSAARSQVYLAKVLGNFLVFLIPLIIAMLIGVLLLNASSVLNPFSGEFFQAFIVIFLVTLLFIFAMLNLGMLVSTLTHSSITSMAAVVFVWVILVLAVPRISPMIAEVVYPVKSEQVVNIEKQLIRENLEKELDLQRRELFEKLMAAYDLDPGFTTTRPEGAMKKAYAQYDEEKIPLEEKYRQRLNTALINIEREFANNLQTQSRIAVNLSRISPASCYSYVISEISGNGPRETGNFYENAREFQNEVREALYDKYIVKTYGGRWGTSSSTQTAEGFELGKLKVFHMSNYKHISLGAALRSEWIDILLLVFFNILFFAAGFVAFNRYDVR